MRIIYKGKRYNRNINYDKSTRKPYVLINGKKINVKSLKSKSLYNNSAIVT